MKNILPVVTATWLNTSQINQFGVGMNRCAGGGGVDPRQDASLYKN